MLYHGANAKLVGKNFAEMRDSSGKEFNKEMIATAKKGSGWVDYQWAHPVTKKVEDKTAYIVKTDNPKASSVSASTAESDF
jgi:cytochrome c